MQFNTFGKIFRITTFGESHGAVVGAVVDGVPSCLSIDEAYIQRDLDRRRPGRHHLVSQREEVDKVRILSGIFEGKTTGAPILLLIENKNARPQDYDELKDVFRPGQADFTWFQKFKHRDYRGGGRASGRETVARVAGGAVARRLLETRGIRVVGRVIEIGGIRANIEDFDVGADDPLFCPDKNASLKMQEKIEQAKRDGDSLGGIVEVRAYSVPAGLGEPVFGKLDATLAMAMMSIGAVKGVEIGDGFALVRMKGSEANDQMNASQGFLSNRAGGILGGISTGETIIVRIAIKPTPSISKEQTTVDKFGREKRIMVGGRHDPCIVPRIVPVAEAMVCLCLADALLIHRARKDFMK